ncbi:hypothetical protein [Curtobacterium luteum]|uniref:hypothetical protein n=1 Tax=Curtobacterium luteum TaxID=33881 RepID=UPI000AA77333|nr:hypothetical protein [Curtobacterium luteum]
MGLARRIGSIDLHGVDEYGAEWITEEVTGWGVPSSSREFTQKPRQSGAWASAGFSKNRDVAITGVIISDDSAITSSALDRLYGEVAGGSVRLVIDEGTGERWVDVLQTDELIATWLGDRAVRYSLQVASTDWRKFGDALSGVTQLPSTSGGLAIGGSDTGSTTGLYTPDQAQAAADAAGLMVDQPNDGLYPLLNKDGSPASTSYVNVLILTGALTVPFRINATTVTGQVNLNNPGNESGPVVLRIDGPCTGPVVTHVSTGNALVFSSSLVLQDNEFLLIDMDARTALANGQANRAGYITSRGWSSFDPGDNTWAFSAARYNSESQLSVAAVPAWR